MMTVAELIAILRTMEPMFVIRVHVACFSADDLNHFEDRVSQGAYGSREDFAYVRRRTPETLERYFDWDAWTRDLFLDG